MRNITLFLFSFLLSFTCYGQVPAPIAGSASVCTGTTITLTDITTGGAWSSSSTSVTTVGSVSGTVTGVSAGTAIITYTTGTGYAVKTVTVNLSPSPITGPLAFCGGFETLASSPSGGTWSTTIPTGIVMYIDDPATGSIFGNSPGTANIIYTLGTGCSATSVVTVEPFPGSILGSAGGCVGMVGGFSLYPSYPVIGAWSSSDTSVMTVNSSGVNTAVSAGTATIFYTCSDGCNSSLTLTVVATPPSISGTTTVCTGFTTALSDASTGGYWASDNTAIATVDTGTGLVTGLASGVTSITYWGSDYCPVGITVTVNGPPAITGASTAICMGYNSTLNNIASGGTWSSGNTAVATVGASTGIVGGISSGTAMITYTYGCGFATKMVTVITAVSPIAGIASLCIGSSATLNDAIPGGMWSSGGVSIATINPAGTVTGISPGSATITYAISSGCFATQIMTVIAGSIASHSIISTPDTFCSAPDFYISACGVSSSFNVTTWYGDGASGNTALTSSGICHANVSHTYAEAGTYSVKQVLYFGSIPVDSVTFTYEYLSCKTLPVKFYFDANNDCVFDSGDVRFSLPVLTEIDSNGISIDTISATSGFYYQAYGALPGTIYSFRVITSTGGLYVTCPLGDILQDTIQSIVNEYHEKDFGFNCIGGSVFDLQLNDEIPIAGRHDTWGNILVQNTYCAPVNATITVHFSPKYVYTGWSDPPPDDSTATSLTWSVSNLSARNTTPIDLLYVLYANPATGLLTAGDTVQTVVHGDPLPGDTDTTNNTQIIIDTVKASGDPNEMAVAPGGYILPGTQLQYSINFENTGTDTAHNIYVMDTLPDNVDPRSLRIVSTTAFMNISIINDGLHNIVKFDFTGINLLDTSYHRKYDGAVIFTIKSMTGLADGTTILNHAGIFFDYNAAVITDTVENIIGLINGPASVCAGASVTLSELAPGGTWSASNTAASVAAGIVTGITPGLDTILYTVTTQSGTVSTTKIISINTVPAIAIVSGPDNVCIGSVVTFSDSDIGGTWGATNSNANVSAGLIYGMTVGTDSISYSMVNSCGTASVFKMVTVNPIPDAGIITGADSLCVSSTAALSESVLTGIWSASNSHATVAGGIVTGVTAGTDSISYTVTNICAAATAIVVTVNTVPDAGIITGPDSVCATASITLIESAAGGIWSASNSNATISAGIVTGVTAGTDSIHYTITNTCGATSASKSIAVHPLPLASSVTGSDSVCAGSAISLTASTPGGAWSVSNTNASIASGVVTGVSAGADSVIYTLTNLCGAASTAHVLIINPLPAAGTISGDSAICLGAPLVLAEDSPKGIWSSVNSAVAAIDPASGFGASVSTGVDTIKYAITNSCGVAVAIAIVSVNPVPSAITGVTTICQGLTALLSDMTPDGTWSSANTWAATVEPETGEMTGVTAGTALIHYTLITGCAASLSLTVSPAPASITGAATVCIGDSIILSDATFGGLWSSSDTTIMTVDAASGVAVGLSAGMPTVTYTSPASCNTSATISVNPCVTGLQTLSGSNTIEIYPNPTNDELTISAAGKITEVLMTDLLGQIIYSRLYNDKMVHIDMTGETPGIYLIRINGKRDIVRVVKE